MAPKGAGKILLVGKAAGGGDLLNGEAVFDQEAQCLVHSELDNVLLRRDAVATEKLSLQARSADKSNFAHLADVKLGLAEVLLDILEAESAQGVLKQL